MGQIFTTKYQFIYNTNLKQIGFYNTINLGVNEDKKDRKTSFLVVILFALCIFIFTILGIFIGKKIFWWRRKVIVNELIEELNYEYKIENNEIKSNITESKYKSIGNKNNLLFEMKNKFSE